MHCEDNKSSDIPFLCPEPIQQSISRTALELCLFQFPVPDSMYFLLLSKIALGLCVEKALADASTPCWLHHHGELLVHFLLFSFLKYKTFYELTYFSFVFQQCFYTLIFNCLLYPCTQCALIRSTPHFLHTNSSQLHIMLFACAYV